MSARVSSTSAPMEIRSVEITGRSTARSRSFASWVFRECSLLPHAGSGWALAISANRATRASSWASRFWLAT